MGYLHVQNLYKDQTILMFKRCFALEKIHGTSAHISWRSGVLAPEGKLGFFSGGESHERFTKLFDAAKLREAFTAICADHGHDRVTVYGEAYGGSQQKMSETYGKELRFIAFDVYVGEAADGEPGTEGHKAGQGAWLNVPAAHDVATKLGLEFVHYVEVDTGLPELDFWRDAPSEQAKRNGIEALKAREGVVLRPLIELTKNDGGRIIAKHKGEAFKETKTSRSVAGFADLADPARMQVLADAEAIAGEWVTAARLGHVLGRLAVDGVTRGVEHTSEVIKAMVEDVEREAKGEIVSSKEAQRAIGKATAALFKRVVVAAMREKVGA